MLDHRYWLDLFCECERATQVTRHMLPSACRKALGNKPIEAHLRISAKLRSHNCRTKHPTSYTFFISRHTVRKFRKSTYIPLKGILYSHQYRWHLGLFQEFHDNINSIKLLRYRQMPTPLITQQYYIGSLMKALSTAPKILSFTGASAWYQGVLCIEVLWNGWEVTKFHFKIFFPSTMNSLPVD